MAGDFGHGDSSPETNGSRNKTSGSEKTIYSDETTSGSQAADHGGRPHSNQNSCEVSTGERSSAEQSADDSAAKQSLNADEVYCFSCGIPIKKQAEICPQCGVRQRSPPTSSSTAETTTSYREKSPPLAAVGSMLWTGAGQIYNGQLVKGIALMVLLVVNGSLVVGVALTSVPVFSILLLMVLPIIWVYGVVDAYRTAASLNGRQDQTNP
jgi:TM2 domain-containing membrane protein YozV